MPQLVILVDNKSSNKETKGSKSSHGQKEIVKPTGGTNQQGTNKHKGKKKTPGGGKSLSSNDNKGKDGSNLK
jgi:hypothetical protein